MSLEHHRITNLTAPAVFTVLRELGRYAYQYIELQKQEGEWPPRMVSFEGAPPNEAVARLLLHVALEDKGILLSSNLSFYLFVHGNYLRNMAGSLADTTGWEDAAMYVMAFMQNRLQILYDNGIWEIIASTDIRRVKEIRDLIKQIQPVEAKVSWNNVVSGSTIALGDNVYIGDTHKIDALTGAKRKPFCFDSLFPSPFHTNQWQDLLVYCYNEFALEKVKADLEKRLKTMDGTFDAASDKSKVPVPENALLTVVPEIKDVVCNPPQAQVYVTEDYHCVPFRVKYEPKSELAAVLGRGEVHGRIKIFLEGLLIGEIPIESIWKSADTPPSGTPRFVRMGFAAQPVQHQSQEPVFKHTVGYRYRKIFASYSRKDTEIVKRLEKAYQVLGDDVWRDIRNLKSGTDWSEEIGKAILNADVFQLFWSENARQSENVEKEWRTALTRELPHFIRPVYWEVPIAPLPEELKAVTFTFLEV
jgi:TIR domain